MIELIGKVLNLATATMKGKFDIKIYEMLASLVALPAVIALLPKAPSKPVDVVLALNHLLGLPFDSYITSFSSWISDPIRTGIIESFLFWTAIVLAGHWGFSHVRDEKHGSDIDRDARTDMLTLQKSRRESGPFGNASDVELARRTQKEQRLKDRIERWSHARSLRTAASLLLTWGLWEQLNTNRWELLIWLLVALAICAVTYAFSNLPDKSGPDLAWTLLLLLLDVALALAYGFAILPFWLFGRLVYGRVGSRGEPGKT